MKVLMSKLYGAYDAFKRPFSMVYSLKINEEVLNNMGWMKTIFKNFNSWDTLFLGIFCINYTWLDRINGNSYILII